jgi:alkylhydroperoxidase family enzyme
MSWDPAPDARSLAPTALSAWTTLTAQAAGSFDRQTRDLIHDRIGVLFAGAASGGQPSPSADQQACAEAVEQFIIDVSAMTDSQRAGVSAAMGAGVYPFFQTVYVFDLDFRFRAARAQVFGERLPQPRGDADSSSHGPTDLWPALDRFLTDVAALSELDPVTTELIRLRGARAHNCRICQSRRDVRAIGGGADESTFDKIDFYETSDLPERQKVALRLTDAMIWQPAAYPAGLAAQVRAHFTPSQALEIVLDVVRNAANKVAVALQADQAVVTSGVEYFTVSPEGDLAYGLPAPV